MSKSELIIPNVKRTRKSLTRLQELPLDQKIALTKRRIDQFYKELNGKVYVSFSGGKDSTVLLHIVRSLFPQVRAVFCDTGVEYPGIKQFVNNTENVVIIKPKISFASVLKKYGYPMISKPVSMGFDRYRNTKSETQKQLRLNGGINPTSGKTQQRSISIKYHYLLNFDIKISDRCCDILKKNPAKKYHKDTGLHPITGEMATESKVRADQWVKNGCNGFNLNIPKSTPLSFWLESDIWEYIERYKINLASPYSEGEERTGCMFCLYGCQYGDERGYKRFDRMKNKYPLHYKAAEKLGIIEALNLIKKEE